MVQVKVRLCSAPSNCSNFNTVNWYAEKKVHDFFDWSSGCICIENHVSFFLLIDVIQTPKNAQVFALHKCLSPLFIWTRFFQSSSLKYQVWWTGFFSQFETNWIFFPVQSFWHKVEYFDGPCLTIYSLSTIYRDIHYQFLVRWIHYSHCCESKIWKPGKISSLFTLIWLF